LYAIAKNLSDSSRSAGGRTDAAAAAQKERMQKERISLVGFFQHGSKNLIIIAVQYNASLLKVLGNNVDSRKRVKCKDDGARKKKPEEHPEIKNPEFAPGKGAVLNSYDNPGDEEGSEKHSKSNESLNIYNRHGILHFP
jgi:hypothetical protein